MDAVTPQSELKIEPVYRGIDNLMPHVDYRLAETKAERETVYRLRYEAYLREGAVAVSPERRTVDSHEDFPNNWIFGVYVDGELCSSIRIGVLNRKHRTTPSAELFPDILDPILERDAMLVDPTRFVADYEASRRYPDLAIATTRLAILACEHFNAELGLAIVRREHQPFYTRTFMHEPIAEPRMFPGLIKPVGLMGVKYQEKRDDVLRRRPYFRSSAFERRMLFKDSVARMQ